MIIYLDQNKWIDLAKAIINPRKNPKYVKAANLVVKKIENSEWILPLSSMHVFETSSRAEKESRKRLVNVMAKISNGYSIKSFLDIQKIELMNIFLNICNPEKIQKIEAVVKNPLVAIGLEKMIIDSKTDLIPENIKQQLSSIITTHLNDTISDKVISNILLDNYDKNFVEGFRNDDTIMTELFETNRENLLKLPKQHRYKIFLIKRFWGIINELNININELCKNKEKYLLSTLEDKNNIIKLLEGAPSFNVSTKLTYELLKDKERPIQKHDNRDINFLTTALPYSDVIITERTWKHLIVTNKLDNKYSTIVENDLNYLLNLDK